MTFAQHMGENRHWSAGIYWSAGMTFAQNGQEQIDIEMLKMRIQGVFLEVPQSSGRMPQNVVEKELFAQKARELISSFILLSATPESKQGLTKFQ